jgi:hypothetical protein
MVIAEAGGVQPLIETLSDPRTHIQEQAAAALAKLAFENELTRDTITKSGGVAPLVGLLAADSAGDQRERVRTNAADAIANLALEPAARDEVVGGGGMPLLVALLQGEGRTAKQFAAMALARLARDHKATQAAIAAAGAITALVALLSGDQGPEAQEEAAGALFALADLKENRLAITRANGTQPIVELLACENPRTFKHAEGALVRLSIEDANRVLIINLLVEMLQTVDSTAQEQVRTSQRRL